MVKKKRFLSAFLALMMILSLLPASALAAPAEHIGYLSEEEQAEYDRLLSDRLALMLLGDDVSLFSTDSHKARYRLNNNTRTYYDAIAEQIPKIAKNGGSTVFNVPNTVALTATDAFKLHQALCVDFPYETYWKGASYGSPGNGVFAIEVSADYRYGSNHYAVAPAKAAATSSKVAAASKNVKDILSAAEGLTDLEKLVYFKEEICRLVSYNEEAAGWPVDKYGDPWQIIYVFDGNSGTNVVCEGYAKAFQYLCDLSLSEAQCYSVTGKMRNLGHMWNIVTLEGSNYLVDVTGCDGFTMTGDSGTMSSGYPFGLFLAGASGSPTTGYTVNTVPGPFKYLWIEGNSHVAAKSNQIKYTYDADTVWNGTNMLNHDENVLTLSGDPYPLRFYEIEETGLNVGTTYTWRPLLKQGFTFAAASAPGSAALPSGVSVASDGTITYKPLETADATDMTVKITYKKNEYPYYYTLELPPVTTNYTFELDSGNSVGYGDSLTVSVKDLKLGGTAMTDGTVKLYYGEKELAGAAVSGGTATLAYDTKTKGLPVGSHRLMVKYVPAGDGAQQANLGTVDVDLTPRKLTGAVAAGVTKPYSGGTTFAWVRVTLDGVLDGDTVTATATVTAGSADAGENKQVTGTRVTLEGADAGYYAAPDSVEGTITVTKKHLSLSDVPEQTVPSGQETADRTVALPALPDGAGYGAVTVDQESTLISGTPTVEENVLTFSTASQPDGTTAIITVKVDGGTNYNDGAVAVAVKAVAKQDAGVSFTGTVPASKTFGDQDFTLRATASNPGTDGRWNWTSTNPDVLSVEGSEDQATVTVKKAGTATITATYECDTTRGSATTPTITVAKTAPAVTAPKAADLTYTGQPQDLVTAGSAAGGTMWYATEENGTYSETIPTGTDAGNYTVYYKVEGDSDHGDTEPRSVQVTIKSKSITKAEFGSIAEKVYTGSAIEPAIKVTDGDKTLVEDTDYTVTYGGNTNAGEATVTVTGKGNYGGTKRVKFTINPMDITQLPGEIVTVNGTYTYTGSKIKPNVEVKDDDKTLTEGTDYTVEYGDNTNAGPDEGTVTITGKGNYTGDMTVTFDIERAEKPEDIFLTKEVPLTATIGSIPLSLPDVPGSLINVTYDDVTAASKPEGIEATGEVTEDGELTYSITGTPADGNKITFTIQVYSDNYEAFEIEVEIILLAKRAQDALTVKPGSVKVVYPGTVKLAAEGGSGSGAVTYEIVEGGTGEAAIDGDVLVPARAGTVKVVAKKDGGDMHLDAVSAEVEIVIEKGAATVRADDKRMTASEALPEFTYTVDPAGVAVKDVKVACETGDSPAAKTYDITVTGPNVSNDGNYSVTYEKGTLTVGAAPLPHVHTWSTAWSSDSAHHWHECGASGCDVSANSGKDGYAEHVPGDWIVDQAATSTADGRRHKECTVCGYTTQTGSIPRPDHVHTWSTAWSSDSANHWHECACGEKNAVAAHIPGDWIVDKAATATSTGLRHEECAVCGHTMRTETIPATDGTTGASTPGWSSRPSSSSTPSTSGWPNAPSDPVTPGQTVAKPDVTTQALMTSAVVTSAMGSDIVAQAARDRSGSVVIAPEMWNGATRSKVSIPAETLRQIGARTNASLTVSMPMATVTIPNGNLAEIGRDAGGKGEILVTASVVNKESRFMAYEVGVTKGGREISAGQASGIALSVPVAAAKKARAGLTVKTPAAEVTFQKETIMGLGWDDTLGVAVTMKNTLQAGRTAYDVTILKNGKPIGTLAQSVKVGLPVSGQDAMLMDRYGNEVPVPESSVAEDGRLHIVMGSGSTTVVLKNKSTDDEAGG